MASVIQTYRESVDAVGVLPGVTELWHLVGREAHARGLSPLSPLEQSRVDLSEQLQQSPRGSHHSLVPALPVLDQVSEQVLLHAPRLPLAHLSDRVDTGRDDLGSDTGVDKLLGEFADDRGEHVRRGELVDRLGE